MTDPDNKLLGQILDNLWGAVNEQAQLCEELADHRDARVEAMWNAVNRSQDLIQEFIMGEKP